jgi:hypothetical protein
MKKKMKSEIASNIEPNKIPSPNTEPLAPVLRFWITYRGPSLYAQQEGHDPSAFVTVWRWQTRQAVASTESRCGTGEV